MKRVPAACLLLVLTTAGPGHAQIPAGPVSLKMLAVNGVQLAYLDRGGGVPVIFIHGGLEDYRSWAPQLDAFAKGYRVIAYSRRYNYPNPARPADVHYSALVDAEDLAAFMEKLDLAPAHIVGLSHGAYVGLALAARHPKLVRSLVLSEAPLLNWLPKMGGGQALYAGFMSRVWEPATLGFRKGDEAGVRAAVAGFGELGYSGTEEKLTLQSLPAEVRAAVLQNASEWRVLTASTDPFASLSFEEVRGIGAPTLLLSGERSLALHHLIDGRLLTLLPHAERTVIKDATHEMWGERPEECRALALAFLALH